VTRALAAASVLLLLLLAGAARVGAADPAPAAAPPPPPPSDGSDAQLDPAAADAAAANLEPVGRHGVVFSASALPGMFIGFGSRGDSGLGGEFSLRLGKTASSTTTMYFELQGGGLVHQPPNMPATSNALGGALVGALHYVAPSLWLRVGLGWGSYVRNDEQVNGALVAHETLAGPLGDVGLGIDLVRWKSTTLGLEISGSTLLHRHGVTTMSGTGLGLTF
jgi:hypothetical protein